MFENAIRKIDFVTVSGSVNGDIATTPGVSHGFWQIQTASARGRMLYVWCSILPAVKCAQIKTIVKDRINATEASDIPFLYDGESGLDNFLSSLTDPQRCTWRVPRGLYHALWEDGLREKDCEPEINKITADRHRTFLNRFLTNQKTRSRFKANTNPVRLK